MIYVSANDLRVGMRLAKPIYNKNGVLLYDRNDKITKQGIDSVRNFGLIGLYILEPAEPVPPMTEEEIEFERFQTMGVYRIKEVLDAIMQDKTPENLMKLVDDIVRGYGDLYHKIIFTQNLRSPEDYTYKHALNVAILVALMSRRARLGIVEQNEIVIAAILHDIGRLFLSPQLRGKSAELDEEDIKQIKHGMLKGFDKISYMIKIPAGVKRLVNQLYQLNYEEDSRQAFQDAPTAVKIMLVANTYDKYTAMQLGIPPHSEVAAIRKLQMNETKYDKQIIKHLINSVKVLYPGVCIELSNHEKGLVLRENDNDILRPMVLGFNHNKIYDLSDDVVFENLQITDIMKTMDNRIKVDSERLKEYMQ